MLEQPGFGKANQANPLMKTSCRTSSPFSIQPAHDCGYWGVGVSTSSRRPPLSGQNSDPSSSCCPGKICPETPPPRRAGIVFWNRIVLRLYRFCKKRNERTWSSGKPADLQQLHALQGLAHLHWLHPFTSPVHSPMVCSCNDAGKHSTILQFARLNLAYQANACTNIICS